MEAARTKVRAIILAITGGIVTLLVLRFILIFAGADQGHFLVRLLLDLSGILVYPFQSFGNTSLPNFVDSNALLAILMYVILGILISELITALLQDNAAAILRELIDAAFKFIEFLLICRIVFRLFGLTPQTGAFVSNVYAVTEWSLGILPSRDFLFGILEVSTVIVLIIVVLIDLATEGFLTSMSKRISEWKANRPAKVAAPKVEKVEKTVVVQAAPAPVVVNQPAPQSITINVPVPPPAPVQPERQVINVHPAPSATISSTPNQPKEG